MPHEVDLVKEGARVVYCRCRDQKSDLTKERTPGSSFFYSQISKPNVSSYMTEDE
jgi:hypothetical protein